MAKAIKKTAAKKAPGVKAAKKPEVKTTPPKAAPKDESIFKETENHIFKIDGTANHFQLLKIDKSTNISTRVLTSGGTTLQAFKRVCELYFKN